MSFAADILKAAIERQATIASQQLADVREKCEAANKQLGKSLLQVRVEELNAMKSLLSGEPQEKPEEG